jgi:hypothetical protein
MSVQLGEFGTVRLSLSGQGAETAADFNSETISARVIFTPSTELKTGLADIRFEKAE